MESKIIESPIGKLALVAEADQLKGILFSEAIEGQELEETDTPILKEVADQVFAYFSGTLKTFDLPLAPEGTAFQQKVWKAVFQIPFGHTNSYKQIANQLGAPKTIRAVGRANGSNPIPIVVPCHRVIGANHQLVGYAGGLERKRWLLEHEAKFSQKGVQQQLF